MTDVDRVYETLCAGGLALVPTVAGYGLVAIEERAVRKIYELKGRPVTKPCVTIATPAVTENVAAAIEPNVRAWITSIALTTPLAVVTKVAANSSLRNSQSAFVRDQTMQNGVIGLFYAAGWLVENVAERAQADGKLVIGSSANLHGTSNTYAFSDVPYEMLRGANLVLDRGLARQGHQRLPSTVLDLGTGKFLRRGIEFDHIAASWRRLTERVAVEASLNG